MVKRRPWKPLLTAVCVACALAPAVGPAVRAQAVDIEGYRDALQAAVEQLNEGLAAAPAAVTSEERSVDSIAPEITRSIEFALDAMARGDLTLAADTLAVTSGLLNVSLVSLPAQPGLGDLGDLAGVAGAESPSETVAARSAAGVASPSVEARVDTAIAAASVNSQTAPAANRSAADTVTAAAEAAADSTTATQSLASVNLAGLEKVSSGLGANRAAQSIIGSQSAEIADTLSKAELSRVSEMVSNMADARQISIVDSGDVAERLASGGYDVAGLQDTLQSLDVTIEDVVNAIGGDATNLGNIENALNDLLNDPSSMEAVSFEAGSVGPGMGRRSANGGRRHRRSPGGGGFRGPGTPSPRVPVSAVSPTPWTPITRPMEPATPNKTPSTPWATICRAISPGQLEPPASRWAPGRTTHGRSPLSSATDRTVTAFPSIHRAWAPRRHRSKRSTIMRAPGHGRRTGTRLMITSAAQQSSSSAMGAITRAITWPSFR